MSYGRIMQSRYSVVDFFSMCAAWATGLNWNREEEAGKDTQAQKCDEMQKLCRRNFSTDLNSREQKSLCSPWQQMRLRLHSEPPTGHSNQLQQQQPGSQGGLKGWSGTFSLSSWLLHNLQSVPLSWQPIDMTSSLLALSPLKGVQSTRVRNRAEGSEI